MKPITKFYIKEFFKIFLLLTVIGFVLNKIIGDERTWYREVIVDAITAIIITRIIVGFYKGLLNKRGIKEFDLKKLRITESKTVQSGITKTELISRLQSNKKTRKMKLKEEAGAIHLTNGFSMESFGQNIRIEISATENGMNEFRIYSEPKLKRTVYDYGKNRENVKLMERIIREAA